MARIHLIMSKMNIEFKNLKEEFTGWDQNPSPVYAFTNRKEADEEIHYLRNNELERYKNWLKKGRGCFIHHHYHVKEILVFEKELPY